ncbi:MAG: 6-carboxytetrahydropterin synthase QueD [Acidobacteria bacterium]|nr:6-carboxytetrahydropterin synthase QueD [Acidobacteriota bacterium]
MIRRSRSPEHYVELTCNFGIEASHQLPRAPRRSVCRRLHGHSWKIDLKVGGTIDPKRGWLIDYHDIEAAWEPLHDALDHRHLNDVRGLDNPTSENLAVWIFEHLIDDLAELVSVTVHETCTARCEYFGPVQHGDDDE